MRVPEGEGGGGEVWTERILRRIEHAGSTDPTLATLRSLQRGFLHHVPFENLDIHLGRPIRLERARVLEKIVERRRGGFCFELNEVFLVLLEGLGFDATRVASSVLVGGGDAGYLHPFDHETLVVTVDGTAWLADAGFGDAAFYPLRLDSQEPQADPTRRYRILGEEGGFRVEREQACGEWEGCHRLDPTGRRWAEFEARCAFLQTSPESKFARKRLCTLATADGRLTLSGNHLRLNDDPPQSVSEGDYKQVLRDRFGIDVGDEAWVNPLA